ncbi:MAG: hypothetical protein AAGF79_02820, partial [Pseudomonadota bacterium]
MILRVVFLVISFQVPTLLLSQVVTVQSGEHDNFTRLVARLPNGVDWRLEQDGRVARLFFESDSVEFETSDVFLRIPKDRLEDLSQSAMGEPLTLQLACNCPVASFVEDDVYVVLDIENQRSEEPVQFGLTDDQAEAVAEVTLPSLLLPPDPLSLRQAASPDQSPPSIPTLPTAEPSGPTTRPVPVELSVPPAPLPLDQAELALQNQITRAARQGLVSMLDEAQESSLEPRPKESQSGHTTQTNNFRAVTSFDRDMVASGGSSSIVETSGRCSDPDRVDPANWGDERPLGHQLGSHRMQLVSEFDQLTDAKLIELARTYLYFGFGAEASQILSQVSDTTPVEPLLALSRLLDTGALQRPHPFEGQTHCSSPVALWSTYANPVDDIDKVNSGAVVRAFVELPVHLRTHIGPGLARRFSVIGDAETTDTLLRIIDRAAPDTKADSSFAAAELAQLNGDEELSEGIIEHVAHSGVEQSPDAIVALVEQRFQNREALPNDTIVLLDTYLFELRNTEQVSELEEAYVVALALSGDFWASFDVLKEMNVENRSESVQKFTSLLTELSDDMTFLEVLMSHESIFQSEVSLDQSIEVAHRLIQIGFPQKAYDLLDKYPDVEDSSTYKTLKAEAALNAGFPRRALLELINMEGEDVDLL